LAAITCALASGTRTVTGMPWRKTFSGSFATIRNRYEIVAHLLGLHALRRELRFGRNEADDAVELLAAHRVDFDLHRHAGLDAAEPRLRHIGTDPHWIVQRDGVDRLACLHDRTDFARAYGHHATGRREKRRVFECGARLRQIGFRSGEIRLLRLDVFDARSARDQRELLACAGELRVALAHARVSVVHVLSGDRALRKEALQALVGDFGIGEIRFALANRRGSLCNLFRPVAARGLVELRLCHGDLRRGGGHVRFEGHAIELRKLGAGRDAIALIHIEPGDATRDAEGELDLVHIHVAPHRKGGSRIVGSSLLPVVVHPTCDGGHDDHRDDDDSTIQALPPLFSPSRPS
jgi:hypothetical protein